MVKGVFLPYQKKKIVGRWSGGAHLNKSNGVFIYVHKTCHQKRDFIRTFGKIISSRLGYYFLKNNYEAVCTLRYLICIFFSETIEDNLKSPKFQRRHILGTY